MSRCFPYTPTGFALSRASKGPLIGSIKFPKESVKSKKRKERPMEPKKDGSKEQKKKKCEKKEKEDKTHKKPSSDTKPGLHSKVSKAEPVQLEQSSLTEEHGNPTYLLAPSTSANSTDNNNKKREICSSHVEVTRGHGKIIRIRLPLKKPCSTSEQTDVAPKNENTFCSSSGGNDRPVETVGTLKPSMIDTVVTPMQRVELQYTNLVDSLVLLPRLVDDVDDLDWLLKGKSRKSSGEEKHSYGINALTGYVSWGLWPQAQYLQEVDVYALPFTVPF